MNQTDRETGAIDDTREKFRAVFNYRPKLLREIEDLTEDQVTPTTAPFIAGLYLARSIETFYLAGTSAQLDEEFLQDSRRWKAVAGNAQRALADATNGDYQKLKETISKSLSEEDKLHVRAKAREALRLIAQKIPAQGPPLKAPAPVWMEKPMPLREQLIQLQQGGVK